jgi:hypothetical protein
MSLKKDQACPSHDHQIDERDSELQGFFKRLGFDRGRYIDFSKTV